MPAVALVPLSYHVPDLTDSFLFCFASQSTPEREYSDLCVLETSHKEQKMTAASSALGVRSELRGACSVAHASAGRVRTAAVRAEGDAEMPNPAAKE